MTAALKPQASPWRRRRARLSIAEDVRRGLTATPPWLPSKFLYDDRGSELFEEITRLPEYYQTRTEEAILAGAADDIIARTRPSELLELGSGAGRKIRLLLDALGREGLTRRLTLYDINHGVVAGSAGRLARSYPDLVVDGATGDFTAGLGGLGRRSGRLAILFAGTIGNLQPEEVPRFLRSVASRLGPHDAFLVGVDLVKDVSRLEAAYNDSAGVTAAFNLNVLTHVNRELVGDFDERRFAHRAFWDAENGWIEMRLVATAASRVRLKDAWLDLRFAAGDEIRTEVSCKYTRETFGKLLADTGFGIERWYSDPDDLFALALLRRGLQ